MQPHTPIYLDHHATTPVDSRVLARMLPFFCENFGNAASRSHAFGWFASEAVEAARVEVAALVGGDAREVVFTSGATEANNLALAGAVAACGPASHVVTQATEHKAVLDVCAALAGRGVQVTRVGVDAHGRVDPAAIRAALTPRTALVSLMFANNEVGTLQPLAEVGAVCRAAGVLLHTDAAQGLDCGGFDARAAQVDLVSVSAHKLYGPKGVGALWVRRGRPHVLLTPQAFGGGHERGLRPGTLNVPAIVGMGEACRIARSEGAAAAQRMAALRDRLQQALVRLDGITVHGHPTQRLPNNLNVSVAGVQAAHLLAGLRDVAVSSGSACTSASPEPSHVLRAMGISEELSRCSVRFGLGRATTAEEVDRASQQIGAHVLECRAVR